MIKLFFLVIFFLMGTYSPKADETPAGNDQKFIAELGNIKNPFDDGLPKQVHDIHNAVYRREPNTMVLPLPKFRPVVRWRKMRSEIELPVLTLQGVIVGEDVHQAIINNQVVPLLGTIQGARVDSVTKEGVELLFKGKKFFLKVD